MRRLSVFFIVWTLNTVAFAAQETLIWNQVPSRLKSPHYPLKAIKHSTNSSQHLRLQQTYKGIPIFGYELIQHQNHHETYLTGIKISHIEDDLKTLSPTLNPEDVWKIITPQYRNRQYETLELVVYLNEAHQAHLAYHVSFYTTSAQHPLSAPHFIIDAHQGDILNKWNNLHKERLGQGMGGNSLSLPYRAGHFQYGQALPGLPALGKFDVQVANDECFVENESVRVINLKNYFFGFTFFPVTLEEEEKEQLLAYHYPCSSLNQYLNYHDGSTGPLMNTFSPINDTMYFAQTTVEMYQQQYGVKAPLGHDLPLRAFTHVGRLDNAFAIPTIVEGDKIIAHQQIVIGNGDRYITAPSQSVIAHELSHNFTALNSGLLYMGQSGGINEAFSDMAAIALEDYLRQDYPWYWDGEDWSIGREITLTGKPLRYMDHPAQDGASIEHATQYQMGLDVHFASGVFNRAFYLLAHQPGWSIQKAFQVMVDANQHYWSPISYYDFAACGVMQAAQDRGYSPQEVAAAFMQVGVNCPYFESIE